MAYQEPKVNWTSSDGVTMDDLNRIEGNIAAVKNQADNIATTGVPKLVTYAYDITVTADGQTKFDIPYLYFNKDTDTIAVLPSGVDAPVAYTVTNPVTNADNSITKGYVTFTTGRPINSFVKIRIFKNAPMGPEGALSGGVIAQDTLPFKSIIGNANIQLKYSGGITDFNTALTHGRYSFGPTTTNGYVAGYGVVDIFVSDGGAHNNSTNWIWQIAYYTEDKANVIAYRFKTNSGNWSVWRRIPVADTTMIPNLNADLLDGYHLSGIMKYFPINSINIDTKWDEPYCVDISLDDINLYGTKPISGWIKVTNDYAQHFMRQIATTANAGVDSPKMWVRTRWGSGQWSAWHMVGIAKEYQISLLNGWYFGFPSDKGYNGILATLGNVCIGQFTMTAGTVTNGLQIAQLPAPKCRTHITASRQDTGANANFYLSETGSLQISNNGTTVVSGVVYNFHFCYDLASPY